MSLDYFQETSIQITDVEGPGGSGKFPAEHGAGSGEGRSAAHVLLERVEAQPDVTEAHLTRTSSVEFGKNVNKNLFKFCQDVVNNREHVGFGAAQKCIN